MIVTQKYLEKNGTVPDTENYRESAFSFPYPPFCRLHGFLISKGGWVRLDEISIRLGRPAPDKLRSLLRNTGVSVRTCNWHGTALDCVRYEEACRIVDAALPRAPPRDRCRGFSEV